MANIKDFIKKIGNSAVSLEEQQQALAQVEQTIIEAKQKRTEAIGKNAEMVIQALKTIEAKLEAKLEELNNTPAKQGIQGPAGKDGRDGKDGKNGRDGVNGKDGKDGKDGVDGTDGVSVVDAKIDFDGSLVVYLSNGNEIDCGQILQPEVAKNIIISSGGSGTSQVVTDTLVSLQNQINTLTGIDGVLGDMAQQNANAVAITGGTINGTTIGATTPSTGAFTDLTASGQSDLGLNGANNQTFRALAGTGAFPWVQTSHASGEARIRAAATSGAVTFSLSSLGSGTMRFYTDAFANEQFRIARTASSVNYVQVTGSALGVAPVVSVQGSDTNIPLVLQPKGTGALQAQQTDSTATGGNARGANAVDWQTERNTAAQVASANYGMISGGYRNTVSGSYSAIGGGFSNTASATGCGVFGGNSNTASSNRAFVVGGQANTAGGLYNFIGGGWTNSGTANAAVTTQSGTMNATTAVTLSGSNANIRVGQYITGTSIAADTYVAAISGTSLTLSQAASGSSTSTLSFFTPHGVVVGGGNNQATGSYSFIGGGGDAGTAGNRNAASGDWSVVTGGWKNVASGIGSAVVGGGTYDGVNGNGNTASGAGSFVASGWGNTATATASQCFGVANLGNGSYSAVIGYAGSARSIIGNTVFTASQAPIGTTNSPQQAAMLVLGRQTTNATATVLASTSSAAGTTNQVILPNNSAYYFRGEIVAGVTGGGNTKGWFIEGVIKRGANAASTAMVGTPTVTSNYADAGASTWAVAVTADTTNGGIKVEVTGQASTTIRWVAQIRTTEMTF